MLAPLVRAVVAVAQVVLVSKVESGQFQVVDLASLSGESKLLAEDSDGNAMGKILPSVEMDVQVIPIIRITDLREVIHLLV